MQGKKLTDRNQLAGPLYVQLDPQAIEPDLLEEDQPTGPQAIQISLVLLEEDQLAGPQAIQISLVLLEENQPTGPQAILDLLEENQPTGHS